MTLNIIKAEDPITVESIVLTITAMPGVGKTTLAYSSSKPLLLDFDKGSHRAKGRKDTVRIEQWSDVEQIKLEDLEPFDTIIVDTAGRCLDVMTADIIAKDPKKGYAGNLNQQGWGQLKTRFTGFMKFLRDCGKDVVLVAHVNEDRRGDETVERIDMQGGSRQEVNKVSDAMGRLYYSGSNRMLNFNPTDISFGKNPAQLDILSVPEIDKEPEYLANLIQLIKDRLNALSEAQQEEQARLVQLRELLAAIDTADGMNEWVTANAGAARKDKAIANEIFESKGFKFDKSAGKFVEVEPAAA